MNVINGTFPIKEVTVYPNAARIRRILTVPLKKGKNEVIINGLPHIITEESVRIETRDITRVKILDIHSRTRHIDDYDENKYKSEIKKVQALASEQKKLEGSFRNYTDEFLLFLNKENLSDTHCDDLQKALVVQNWEEFFLFLRKKCIKNRDTARDLLFKWIEIQREREIAQKNLEKFVSYDKKKEHQIIATIEAQEDKEEEFHVLYLQPGVQWFPAYSLRADMNNKSISITLFGMITQTTGEDWENVRVLLSTAIPMYNCSIPAMRSKKIKEQDTEIEMKPASIASGKMSGGISDKLMDLDMDGFGDEKEKMDMSMIESKDERKQRRRDVFKKKAKGKKELALGTTTPSLQKLNREGELAAELKKVTEKKLVLTGDLNRINELIDSVDSKILPPFSLHSLSEYYQALYTHLGDRFDPEENIPGTEDYRVNDFFKQGIPLETSVSGFDYRYKVPTIQKLIPSSSVPVQVNVDMKDLPVELLYITIPLEKEVVYLKALFKNEYDNPFPAGPAQVFVENNFLGNIHFPTLGINKGTFISLGTERDIKVIRKEKSERKTGGIVKKGITIRYTIEIELMSYKSGPVIIEVLDRIPMSSNTTEVSISDIEYIPEPVELTKRNIIVWKEELVPKKKKVFTFSYSIKHPEDFRLTMQKGNHPYLGT